MGQLIPVNITEVLPGDTFQQSTSALIRLAPMLAPVMHPLHVRIHHWYVPTRLIWDEFEEFITGSEAVVHPYLPIPAGGFNEGDLGDYLGVPTDAGDAVNISALPFRAYQKIWNDWYRDGDLQNENVIDYTSGLDATTDLSLQLINWEKDYFTVARPTPQQGPSITIPLADSAPVVRDSNATPAWKAFRIGTNTAAQGVVNSNVSGELNIPSLANITLDPMGTLDADLTAAGGSLLELRTAFALQRYAEARSRYGSRYTEYLRYLGIRSSDARLQRPEYLGGGKQTIQFSEVLQTAPTDNGDDSEGVGNLKGHGIGAMRSNRYRRFFEEHGFVISLMSIKPKTVYANGLNRMWTRTTKEDYFQKELQFIGQQELKKSEVYLEATNANATWGYVDRYEEYRRGFSTISGLYRGDLDYWHMARMFTSAPVLNSTFIASNPTDRIFPVPDPESHNVYAMIHNSIQARRMVAANGGESFVR